MFLKATPCNVADAVPSKSTKVCGLDPGGRDSFVHCTHHGFEAGMELFDELLCDLERWVGVTFLNTGIGTYCSSSGNSVIFRFNGVGV